MFEELTQQAGALGLALLTQQVVPLPCDAGIADQARSYEVRVAFSMRTCSVALLAHADVVIPADNIRRGMVVVHSLVLAGWTRPVGESINAECGAAWLQGGFRLLALQHEASLTKGRGFDPWPWDAMLSWQQQH